MGIEIRRIRAAALLLAVLSLGACVAQFRDHGYVPDDALLNEITVGVDTRATVEEIVGVPSTGGILDASGYYYVASRWRDLGAFEPEVVDRQIVAISFDGRGVVSNIERYTLADGRVVPLSRRVTDGAVADVGFLRQLMGSLGNFNAAESILGNDG